MTPLKPKCLRESPKEVLKKSHITAQKESTGVKKRAGLSLKDIAEQLGTVPASDYLITRLPIALSEEMSGWTVNAEAGRKGKPRPLFIIVSTYNLAIE